MGALGHPSDDNTGLIYMQARYMDPVCGRFESEDPAHSGSGWYMYSTSSPVNAVDPDGRFVDWHFWQDLVKFFMRDMDFSNAITSFIQYTYAKYGKPAVDAIKALFKGGTGEELTSDADPVELEEVIENKEYADAAQQLGQGGSDTVETADEIQETTD